MLRTSSAFLLCTLICSCAASSHSASAPPSIGSSSQGDISARFPAPKSGLTLGAQAEALKLSDVLEQVSKSTGVVYSYNDQTLAQLRQTSVQVSRPVTIGPESLYPWFEALLVQHGFMLAVAAHTQPPLVVVTSVNVPHDNLSPLDVPAAQAGFCREHPAVLVTTTLDLPHLDVRTLGNSLRGMLTGPSQMIMPAGNTNTIVLSGTGRCVGDLIELLTRVEVAAAAGQDQRAVLAAEAAKAK